jgi:hypothetical protein
MARPSVYIPQRIIPAMGADGIARWFHLPNLENIAQRLMRGIVGLEVHRGLQINRMLPIVGSPTIEL